jgi:hypothetical protein
MNLLLEASKSGVLLRPRFGVEGFIGRWAGLGAHIFTPHFDPFERARFAAKLRLQRAGLETVEPRNIDDGSLRIRYENHSVATLSARSFGQDNAEWGVLATDGCFMMLTSVDALNRLNNDVIYNVNNALLGPFIPELIESTNPS